MERSKEAQLIPNAIYSIPMGIFLINLIVFYHSEVTICVTGKVTNLDVQIWAIFGEMLVNSSEMEHLGMGLVMKIGIFHGVINQ